MLTNLRAAARYLRKYRVSMMAAGASFFIILSVVPLLTLVLTLLRYLPLTLQDLLDMLERVFPAALMNMAEGFLRELYTTNLAAVVSVTVVVALWSASRGVFGILNGLSAILGGEEYRSYIRRRVTALVYTFLLIIALFVTLGLQVFGETLVVLAEQRHSWLLNAAASLVQRRTVLTMAMLTLLFTLIYAFFPARRMHLRDVILPAALAAFGWLAFSYLFSIYVGYGRTSYFYGSMTTVVLAMLWLYICMSILFYGGVLCRLRAEGKCSLAAIAAFFRN